MQDRKKIFIVDDHPVFRKGLAQLIDEEEDFRVVGEAESVDQAIAGIQELTPDLAIVDITLKDRSGMELVEYLQANMPGLPILVISMHDESLYAERALRAGARGYIMKQEASESVVRAIREVRQGSIYASKKMTDQIFSRFIEGNKKLAESPLHSLTDRELEVFQLIGEGLGISEIGTRLHLSVKTIGTYRERIKDKLNLKTSTELLRYAINWVENEKLSDTSS